jgi:hypothetical protein
MSLRYGLAYLVEGSDTEQKTFPMNQTADHDDSENSICWSWLMKFLLKRIHRNAGFD